METPKERTTGGATASEWTSREALALLAFYAEVGVDAAVAESGWNRLADADRPMPGGTTNAAEAGTPPSIGIAGDHPAAPMPRPRSAQSGRAPTLPSQAVVAAAVAAAASSRSIPALRTAIETFEDCNLSTTATHLVFADGNPQAPIMLVGSPDLAEDLTGRPFAGEAGALLDRMLAAVGLDRTGVYLTTAIPWRPPGGRLPTPIEQDICRPFLERHIALAQPRCLVLFGSFATAFVMRTTTALARLRGKWHRYPVGERETPVMPMLHPDYLLKKPDQKRLAWGDLQVLKARIDAGFADAPQSDA